MSKVSIEQQIAELTPEQRNNMGKIYKKLILSLIAVVLVGVLVGVGLFVEASIRLEKAEEKHDRISTKIELNTASNSYDFSLYDEQKEALNEYYDIKQERPVSLVIGTGISFIGVVAVGLVFKAKYPYFSEKKYSYLKKMQNNANI
jgi:hypothetical protein